MKKTLLFAALFIGSLASAQITITSTGDGNATNPFIWDCVCFPTTTDNVIINHNITMNVDWLLNAGGSITVNTGGSFVEDVMHRSILVDGAGSAFTNKGFSKLTNIAFTNGASGTNTSGFILDTAIFIGAASSFNNSGVISGTDSLLNNGTFDNTASGTLELGDFWNNGTFTNSGVVYSDSLLNTATFNSTGPLYCSDFGNDGPFSQSNYFSVAHNFYNADNITFSSGATVLVGNDMLSGDSLGGSASIVNDGGVSVSNDFLNADALSGSGRYCITNSSTNSGAVTGTLDICDQSPGGGFDVNIGTVAATITNCASTCDVGVAELSADEILIYPNPTNAFFTIEFSNEDNGLLNYELYNLTGEVVLFDQLSQSTNLIDISILENGVYLCKVSNEDGFVSTERIVKN